MYRLADQVRNLALDHADVYVQQRSRVRALCEFDGEKWVPLELVDESQLSQIQPKLRQLSNPPERDSAYSSVTGSSSGHRSPELVAPSITSNKSSPEDLSTPQFQVASFRRSSSFRIPELEVPNFDMPAEQILHEEEEAEEEEEVEQYHMEEAKDIAAEVSDESTDILKDMIIQDRAESAVAGGRRPSILASPSYQRSLVNFTNLAVSEVDLSEEALDCNLRAARQHIISAFPKQFEAESLSQTPLTSFSVYSRAEDYIEMLHVVLVLETRTIHWKNLGPSQQTLDKVTTLPYCWEADLDLPPLSLDEPRVTDEVECIIMGRATYSTILCDNHNDECRKCKGLASHDDCFACDGSGIFKKKPCMMCSGQGQYFCTVCKNAGHVACKTCGSDSEPTPILRQAFVTCTRETVVSPTMEVEGDNKATLITTAKQLARDTIEAEHFAEGTLPVAACGVLIRQRGHIVCATDLQSGARGLFEVIPDVDRVEFKGQLAPIAQATPKPSSIHSNGSSKSTASKRSSWFRKKDSEDADDSASIKSTASSRMKNMFRRK